MYIRCLDGLRAIAIILVIVFHLQHSLPPWLKGPISFWQPGSVGVRLFFVISGFLITMILHRELVRSGRINFRFFFLRRILRIFPVFYFYLMVLLLLASLGIIAIDFAAIFYAFLFIQNLNVAQQEIFPTSWLVKHSWSLSVEEQFYLLYPFLVKRFVSFFHQNALRLMISLTLICSFFRMLNYSFPDLSRLTGGFFFMHCDFLLYGAAIAISFDRLKIRFEQQIYPFRYWFLLLAFFTVVIASRFEFDSAINILICGNLILASVLYIVIFFLLYPNSAAGLFLEMPAMKWIGTISYSLYVWQQLFLGSTQEWIRYKDITLFPYNIILVFVCAYLSHLLVERPFLKLKKRFIAPNI